MASAIRFQLACLLAQLSLARLGERVVLGPPVVLGRVPGRLEPAGFFEPMQGRKQRAGLRREGAAGQLRDAGRHAEPVQLAGAERLEDQEIEGALQEIAREADVFISSSDTGVCARSYRMSIGRGTCAILLGVIPTPAQAAVVM